MATAAAPVSSPFRPRWPVWGFRLTTTVSAILLFDESIFAGQFLSGVYGALSDHRTVSTVAGIAAAAVFVSAILLRWPGRGPIWPALVCLINFGLIALQITAGYHRWLALHVPLGVLLIVFSIGLAVRAWRKR
jgi:hypothetical protein